MMKSTKKIGYTGTRKENCNGCTNYSDPNSYWINIFAVRTNRSFNKSKF